MGKIAFLAAGAAGLGAIAVTLKAGISEWVQSAKVAAQTEAVIKSTGGAANVTAKEVDTLATAIMNKSGIDDEAIKTGENMLLTFSTIRNEVGAGNDIFNQATLAVADMDTAMTHGNSTAESLSKTAILVGKALNDPIKGATALRRVGVQLTDQQTAQIKKFVESGNVMAAQKIILGELRTEFGGTAKAIGDTMPGALNKLKENFNNLAGSIVGGLAPAFSGALQGLNSFVRKLSEAKGFQAKIGVVFDVAKDAFTAVRKSIEKLLFGTKGGGGAGFGGMTVKVDQGVVAKIRDAFANLNWASVGKSILDGVTGALKTAGSLAKQLAGTITRAIGDVPWGDVGRVMGPGLATAVLVAFTTLLDPEFWFHNWDLALAIALVAFGGVFGKIGGKLVKLLSKPFGDAVLGIATTLERVSPKLATAVMSGLMKLPRLLGSFFTREGRNLEDIVTGVFGRLAGLATFTIKVLGLEIAINAITQFATGPAWDAVHTAFTTVETVATNTWAAITAGVTTFGSTIAGAMSAAWEAVRAAMTTVLTTLQGAATTAWSTITAGVSTFGSGLVSAMTTAWNAVRAATTTVLTTITAAVTTAFTTMRTGVTTGMTAISGAMTTGWNAVSTATTSALSTLSAAATTAFATMRTGVTSGMTAIATAMTTAWTEIKAAAVAVWGVVVGAITGAVGRATTAAVAVGQGILSGITGALDGVGGAVKGKLDAIWGVISNVAGLALGAARAIGAALMEGIKQGADALWGSVSGWFKDRANDLVHVFTLGLRGSPKLFTYYLGFEVVDQLVKGAASAKGRLSEITQILGPSLVKAITASLKTAEGAATKGMNNVGKLIVAAAKKYGVDARAALAVAMGEGGIKFGAVGDSGHAFGPFQFNNASGVASGMSAAQASAWANSAKGVEDALRMMADAGAKGLTGLAAIKAIIGGPGWGFERPANAAAQVAKAFEAFKTLGPQVAAAVVGSGPKITAAMRATLASLSGIVKAGSQVIGLENARGIIEGLDKSAPNLVARATAAMQKALDAQKAVLRTAFVTAFNDLANAALTAFDTRWAAWKPPAQRLLDKMQIAEQVKQVQDQLATAMTAITGGGAFEAGGLAKTLGDQLATAVGGAISAIGGAKTEEALNKISAQVQTQLLAEIDQMALTATNQAQAAVDAARTALTAAQAGGDPDAIAAAQAALDTAVGNQRTLEAAILAEKELALGQLVAAEQRRHDAIGVVQREGMAKQLAELLAFLKKHPEEWGKMGAAVNAILASFNVKLLNAGHAWADKFGDGIRAGIPAAVAAARAMAAAVARELPSTSSPLKPAKTGPLSFHPRTMGKAWATNFASGLASGQMGNIVGALVSGAPMPVAAGVAAVGAGGGATTINVYVTGSVTTEQELSEAIYRNLERRGRRNVSIFNR